MKIISIRLDRMRLPLDPPFAAAQPVATLFGGAADRLPAYASFGELRSPAAR